MNGPETTKYIRAILVSFCRACHVVLEYEIAVTFKDFETFKFCRNLGERTVPKQLKESRWVVYGYHRRRNVLFQGSGYNNNNNNNTKIYNAHM